MSLQAGKPPTTPRLLTVVVPLHNEAENVGDLVQRICAALAPEAGRWTTEVLLVDDGSTDATMALVEALRADGWPVGFLQLTRNYGHQAAMAAGLHHAEGDVVVTMDGDLQHPPEELPRMLRAFERGAEVVQMVRTEQAGGSKGLLSAWFYKIFNRISDTHLVPNASDFRLVTRQVAEVLVRIPERDKFLRGLIPSLGFRQVQLEFSEPARLRGTPSYSLGRSLRLAGTAIFNYSDAPLGAVVYLGMIMATASFAVGLAHLAKKLLWWEEVTAGFTDIITAIFFLGGCTLVALGIVGHYQRIILEQLRGRPAWVVRRHVGPAQLARASALEVADGPFARPTARPAVLGWPAGSRASGTSNGASGRSAG
jgi:dolichol-phosphate mannosyltransferase